MTINVSLREGVVLIQIARPGIVTTMGLHPIEASNLRNALNHMDLTGMPFLPSYRIGPPDVPMIDLSKADPNAREVSEL